jgi:hypothetical protein
MIAIISKVGQFIFQFNSGSKITSFVKSSSLYIKKFKVGQTISILSTRATLSPKMPSEKL